LSYGCLKLYIDYNIYNFTYYVINFLIYINCMNEINSKYLCKYFQEVGDFLSRQLPSQSNHTKGKNSYAHLAIA